MDLGAGQVIVKTNGDAVKRVDDFELFAFDVENVRV